MSEFTASTNVDEVIATLRRYQADIRSIVQKPLDDGAFAAEAYLKPYPAPPPDSTYVRGQPPSEKLGTRWTTRRISGQEFVGRELGNNASYAFWVQSDELQARVHQDRWQTDEMAIRQVLPGTVRGVQQALIDEANHLGR